jgi:hypothetical protein
MARRVMNKIITLLFIVVVVMLRQWNLLLRIVYEVSRETIPEQQPLTRTVDQPNNTTIESPSDNSHPSHTQIQTTTPTEYSDPDRNCPFRDSPLYRSIYAYPSPGDDRWTGDILASSHNHTGTSNASDTSTSSRPLPKWPWIDIDRQSRDRAKVHYDPSSTAVQYTTELLVRDIILHPNSCLLTNDPEQAKLFYVPYLPSVEYHNGTLSLGNYETSPFGQALMDATEGDYRAWESTFGLTSKYWQRRNGSDHILVFSEPLHGLWHPKGRRGSFHFIHSQKQLTPPIVISVELSRTFVDKYPNCARKNILMPYPNTDGKWFNGKYDRQAQKVYHDLPVQTSPAALVAEQELDRHPTLLSTKRNYPRPLAQFYRGGLHGSCLKLRQALQDDFQCTNSSATIQAQILQQPIAENYMLTYRQATFCPCPGGDSPSAKRMFDALHAGCIPIILSHDFVWPYTKEFDRMVNHTGHVTTASPFIRLQPEDFAIRVPAQEYDVATFNATTCQIDNGRSGNTTSPRTLQSFIEQLSAATIHQLRTGAEQASDAYSYYRRRPDLPDNPLQEGVLPDGGAAHALVAALAERAEGVLWPACQEELAQGSAQPNVPDTEFFVC